MNFRFFSVKMYFFNYINESGSFFPLRPSILVSLSFFVIVLMDKMVGLGIVFVTVAVRQHVAKSVTETVRNRGDAMMIQVWGVYRRMVKMPGYAIVRIDVTRKTTGRDQRKWRRDRMNRNRNWYRNRHRIFHQDRIRLTYWHHDRFLYWNWYRLRVENNL